MRGLRVVVPDSKPDAGHRAATTGIVVKEAAAEIDIPLLNATLGTQPMQRFAQYVFFHKRGGGHQLTIEEYERQHAILASEEAAYLNAGNSP